MKNLLIVIFSLLFIAVCISACVSKNGNDDEFAAVLAHEAIDYGARLVNTNELPVVKADWTMQKDKNGFTFIVRNADYQTIEDAIFKIFGNSGTRVKKSSSKPASCLFRASDVGVALIAVNETNRIRITCLKEMHHFPYWGKRVILTNDTK